MRQSNNPYIKQIEYIMFHEQEIREAVVAVREDPQHVFAGGNSKKEIYSDPTGNAAIKEAQEIKSVDLESGGNVLYPERWIEIIDLAYNRLSETQKVIMSSRYRQGEHYSRVIARIHIGQTTYHSYLSQIRNWLTIAAAQKGLIKII